MAAFCCGGWVVQPSYRPASSASAAPASGPWSDYLYFNGFNTFYRSPFNAVPTGGTLRLRLVGPASLTNATIQIQTANGTPAPVPTIAMHRVVQQRPGTAPGVGNLRNRSIWEGQVPARDFQTPGVLEYDFRVVDHGDVAYYANGEAGYGGMGSVYPNPFALVYYDITVYARSFSTPAWLRHGIMYEIMPDRFYDGDPALTAIYDNPETQRAVVVSSSGQQELVPIQFHKNWDSTPCDPNVVANPLSPHYRQELALRCNGTWNTDYYGGDLQGIIDKLGYLKSLGVSILYLTPIFEADWNNKYDTGNYFKVDPGFGTLGTFLQLVQKAKALGMHVILDGAFEDISSDSAYFNMFGTYKTVGAWQEHLNPKMHSPYYHWFLWEPGQNPPYQDWFGIPDMVLTNTQSNSYQHFIYGAFDPHDPTNPVKNSVADYWLSLGASGWRLDSADSSNYSIAWWTAFRKAVLRADPNAALIGEDWNNPTDDNGVDWLTGTTWDSTMNYPFRNAIISFFRGTYNDGNVQNYGMTAQQFGSTLMQMLQDYPQPAMYAEMNLLGSQDTERILTILEGAPDANALTPYQQATWKPTPAQARMGIAKLEEVAAFQYGFVGVPDIYYGDEAGMIGYTDPLNRAAYPWGHADEALIHYFQRLGRIRNNNVVLQSGGYAQLYARGQDFAYARYIRNGVDAFGHPAHDATAVVVVNNGPPRTLTIPMQGLLPNGTRLTNELPPGGTVTVQDGRLRLRLSQYGAVMLFTTHA